MREKRRERKRVSGRRVVVEELESRVLLSGLTIIAHGYEPLDTSTPGWESAMGTAIAAAYGPTTAIYTISIHANNSVPFVYSFSRTSGPAPTGSGSANGETVLLVDWSQVSGVGSAFGSAYYNTSVIAPLIFPYITEAMPAAGLDAPLADGPIQLIGHSRGASLISEIAEQLGESGIWVDQLTTLDPRPVPPDPNVVLGKNIIFADNYYQDSGDGTLVPNGLTVPGAYNLGPLTLGGAYNSTFEGGTHSDVHLFYQGTIDTSADASDGEYTVPADYYPDNGVDRTTTGFYYSRADGGARPAAGVSTLFGGTGARVALSTAGTQWPNVAELSAAGATGTLPQGTQIPVSFDYMDSDSSDSVSLFLTKNTNSYDLSQYVAGDPGNVLGTDSTSRTYARGFVDGLAEVAKPTAKTVSLDTTGVSGGSYYVLAAITDGTNTRYEYLPEKITIATQTATTAFVSAAASSVAFGQPFSLTGTVVGGAGGNGTPTGTISFYEGTVFLGRSTVNASGVATFTTETLGVGTYTVTGRYDGDDNFLPETSAAITLTVTAPNVAAGTPVPQYRLYNSGTKEHLYTTDLHEYTVLPNQGWTQEGVAYDIYNGPVTVNGVTTEPFYRLYNTTTFLHLWTTDVNEYNTLQTYGDWNAEGIDGYMFATQVAGTIALYRLNYPPIPSLHLWTTDVNEYNTLAANDGWLQEGIIGWVISGA